MGPETSCKCFLCSWKHL